MPVPQDDVFAQDPSGVTVVPAPGLLGNDEVPCGARATIRIAEQPRYGTVTLNGNRGAFTYESTGELQDDSFVYEVLCDGVPVSGGQGQAMHVSCGRSAGQLSRHVCMATVKAGLHGNCQGRFAWQLTRP